MSYFDCPEPSLSIFDDLDEVEVGEFDEDAAYDEARERAAGWLD